MAEPVPMIVNKKIAPREIAQVPRESVPAVWAELRESIVRGLAEGDGRYSEADILCLVLNNVMTLWRYGDGAMVTLPVQYPQKKIGVVLVLAGDGMGEWLPMLNELYKWAIKNGCDEVEETGRQGWVRVLKEHGWEQRNFQMVRKL